MFLFLLLFVCKQSKSLRWILMKFSGHGRADDVDLDHLLNPGLLLERIFIGYGRKNVPLLMATFFWI